MTDDFGSEIKPGDRLGLTVGMPPMEVVVTVRERRGRMVVVFEDGAAMSLTRALRYFSAEVVPTS